MPARSFRSSRSSVRRVPRRRTAWSTTLVSGQAIGAATQIGPVDMTNDLAVAGVGFIGGTVLRTHLRISVSSLTTDTNPGINYGIVVYDKTVVSATQPNVLTDNDIDWMIQTFLSPGTSNGPVVDSGAVLYGESLDLKAKRRLHEVNDRPFFVIRNNGSASATVSWFAKQLVALP